MGLSSDWLESVLTKSSDEAWKDVFNLVKKHIPKTGSDVKTTYRKIEDEISAIDDVLASSAWNLWEDFDKAKRASEYVREFWIKTPGPKAVLILDSLSIREIEPICSRLSANGINVHNVDIAASEIPSETDLYANAIGLSGRAALSKGKLIDSAFFYDGSTFVDSFKNLPFEETKNKISNDKNVFIWHGWPDDSLHEHGKYDDAFNRFIDHVKITINSDGFIDLIKKLSQGRELLITSDHGYCNTSGFPAADGAHHQELKSLGHTRAKKVTDIAEPTKKTIPPATIDMKATSTNEYYRLAIGRRRPNDKGFPALTHGGLSLMECVVPLIHVTGGLNE